MYTLSTRACTRYMFVHVINFEQVTVRTRYMLSRSLSSLARNTESLHDFFRWLFFFLVLFFLIVFFMTVLFLDDCFVFQ